MHRMQGQTQPRLIMASDESLWVVKFKNNAQHLRVLANEYIASRIAASLEMSVPECAVIEVGEWLVNSNPDLVMQTWQRKRERCDSGLQFGSRYAGGLMPGLVLDALPDTGLKKIRNLNEFAGILAFDKWLGNSDRRQTVFVRSTRQKTYRAVFIDHGFCFNAGEWNFPDHPLRGVFRQPLVYQAVTGWGSFEPWLNRIEEFRAEDIWTIITEAPHEWHQADSSTLERLTLTLYRRRLLVRDLIRQTVAAANTSFPNWRGIATARSLPDSKYKLLPGTDHAIMQQSYIN